ncbi:MAG: enoyl-CoA hydratase-related protein [Gammaproteobacteria bacterium]
MIKETEVKLDISNHIATITLNRPEVHNAFNENTIELLLAHFNTISQHQNIRAIVLTHEGPHFSAGADLNWMGRMSQFSFEENYRDAKRLGLMFKTLYEFSIPTIGVIRGGAYGGGAGLAAICKIVLASHDATFCFSETKLGLIPATISPYVIHAIGARQALRYFMTAEKFSAQDALRIGLCHEVVDHSKLQETLHNYLSLIIRNGPQALKSSVDLIRTLSPPPISDSVLNYTVEAIAKIRVSPEGQAGIAAFLEKRRPDWA